MPMTAQAAQQQGIYLAKLFNATYTFDDDFALNASRAALPPYSPLPVSSPPINSHASATAYSETFHPDTLLIRLLRGVFGDKVSPHTVAWIRGGVHPVWAMRSRGSMAYIGGYRAVVQTPEADVSGLSAWLIWRGAYFTMLVSWRNKFLVPMQWLKTWVFGRDTSSLYDWRKACYKLPVEPKTVLPLATATTSTDLKKSTREDLGPVSRE